MGPLKHTLSLDTLNDIYVSPLQPNDILGVKKACYLGSLLVILNLNFFPDSLCVFFLSFLLIALLKAF